MHADTRAQAMEKMRDALRAFRIEGIPSTVGFHREVMEEEAFIQGHVTTRWVEQTLLPERKARQKARAEAAKAAQA